MERRKRGLLGYRPKSRLKKVLSTRKGGGMATGSPPFYASDRCLRGLQKEKKNRRQVRSRHEEEWEKKFGSSRRVGSRGMVKTSLKARKR